MIVANIIVHACDHCDALFAVKDEGTRAEHIETWFVGPRYEFCGKCRLDEATAVVRRNELSLAGTMAANGVARRRGVEYVN